MRHLGQFFFPIVLPFLLTVVPLGWGQETTDINQFKALMQRIFIQELGEDLQRKLEVIATEGVALKKTNKEIDEMVRTRLTTEEKMKMKRAYEAIAGPAKNFAKAKASHKGQKFTRSSQFKKLEPEEPAKSTVQNKNRERATQNRENVKNKNRRDQVEL